MDEYRFNANSAETPPTQQGYAQAGPPPNYAQGPYYGQAYAPYGQPAYAPTGGEPQPMTVGEWIVTSLLMAIPIVNIVLLFVWAFGSQVKPSKKSWAQAGLIMLGVALALALLITIIALAAGAALMNGYRGY